MAGGKRFKFAGSKISVLENWAGDSPSSPITAITRANPAVVSETAHGRGDGDVVRIKNVVGMTEVNDGVFVIKVLTTGTYQLLGVNSTDYGAYVSGGIVDEAKFSTLCELTGYNRQGGTSAEIDATTQCSTAKEFEVDLPDFGTTQIDYNFAPRVTLQQAIQAAYESGEPFAVRVELPKSGGVMVQLGFVQQTSEQTAVGALWTASFTMRNTGKRYDFAS